MPFSSHLHTGRYFNPHAQRIIEAKERWTDSESCRASRADKK